MFQKNMFMIEFTHVYPRFTHHPNHITPNWTNWTKAETTPPEILRFRRSLLALGHWVYLSSYKKVGLQKWDTPKFVEAT